MTEIKPPIALVAADMPPRIGDRTPGDEGSYTNDDSQAVLGPD